MATTTAYVPAKIGTGNAVHAATATKVNGLQAYRYKMLCNAKPNRTGGIMRIAYGVAQGTPVTCKNCLRLLAEQSA